MIKVIIKYYEMKSDHIFASPEYDRQEVVEYDREEQLERYIKTKKDLYGFPYEKKKSFGFDYVSKQGAIQIKRYKPVEIKKI